MQNLSKLPSLININLMLSYVELRVKWGIIKFSKVRSCIIMITIDSINNMMSDRKVMICQAMQKLGIQASDEQVEQWLSYLQLLKKWNKTYNMTAITDIDEMLIKHLFDSLSIAHYIKGNHIADVGTGGGLPGIPLAILMPEKSFTLIDSVGKKIRFLNHVKKLLKLNNVSPINIRVENYQPKQVYDQVISRAFSSTKDFYDLCAQLIKNNQQGQLLVMKGAIEQEKDLRAISGSTQVEAIEVPFLQAQRHLIIINSK